MATVVSQNGWPVNPPRRKRQIGNQGAAVTVADGPAGDVLVHVCTQIDLRVEDIDMNSTRGEYDDWGYANRNVRGSADISNHASATAVDINATRHPLGVRNTFSAKQVAEIHKILDEVDNVVRWGGDYRGRVDEMHFEINDNYIGVKRVADRLRRQNNTEDDVSYDDAYRAIRDYFNRKIVNPRDDAKPGTTTTLATQLQFSDWRYVRLIRVVQDMVRPLYNDEAAAAAAFSRIEQQLADAEAKIPTAEEIVDILIEQLGAEGACELVAARTQQLG